MQFSQGKQPKMLYSPQAMKKTITRFNLPPVIKKTDLNLQSLVAEG